METTDILSPFTPEDHADGFSLSDISPVKQFEIPEATVRNKAAVVSLLSDDPNKAVEQYSSMVQEASQGSTDILDKAETSVKTANQERDLKAVMGVLSDPKFSFETKQKAVAGAGRLKSTHQILMDKGLMTESTGETREAEAARINLADNLPAVEQALQKEQAMVNAFVAGKDWATASTISDFIASVVVPGATAKTMGSTVSDLTSDRKGAWSTISPYILPGSATKDFADKYAALPVQERVAKLQDLIDSVNKNSGFILDDNALNQIAMFNSLRGDYSTFEKYLDNGANILDAIGLGALGVSVRSAFKARKVTKAVDAVQSTASVEKATGAMGGELGLRPRVDSEIKSDIFRQQEGMIKSLEDEKAMLLGPAGNQLDKGAVSNIQTQLENLRKQVKPADPQSVKALAKELQDSEQLSYKQALAQASRELGSGNADIAAQINRLTGELERNATASSSMQRIAAIEKEVKQLKENMVDAPGSLTTIADAVRRIELRSLTHTYHPTSPAAIVQQSNPAQARALFHAVFNSVGDEVAKALYGTTRIEAIAGDVLPQVTTASGKVLSKPVDMQRNLRNDLNIPESVLESAELSGAIQYSATEKAMAIANRVNDFESATGMKAVINMTTHTEGGITKYSGVYGTAEGAFTDAEEAIKQAKYAWADLGILDEELTVMARQGNGYVPVDLKDVKGIDGDYLVRVDSRNSISPRDVTEWDVTTVKNNLLDRLGSLTMYPDRGSLSRWLFDIPAMLDKVYSQSFTVAKDHVVVFEKAMLDLAGSFADKFNSLDELNKVLINDYVRRANAEGLKFDPVALMAEGMNQTAIDAVADWRKFWDTHYHFENLDVVRTLDAQGYKVFNTEDTTLFAKPVSKRATSSVGDAYDPLHGTSGKLTNVAEEELYANGGYYAKLRRPAELDGKIVEYMVIRNTPNEYLRSIRETDRALNYRDGYYQIQYKAPRFIDETTPQGITRAVAVAGDTAEAEHLVSRLAKSNPDNKYAHRPDDRAIRTGTDDWFDINSASGRVAQRHRGKLLEGSNSSNILAESKYVVQPIDSAIHAARSIGGRTIMRPTLEAAKARFMANRKDVLTPDNMGFYSFPTSLSQIGKKGGALSKDVADARTEFEAIAYMERGYINSMDNIYKAMMNMGATKAGKLGLTKVERLANAASEINPTGDIKGAVFMSSVASSFHRQWIVQMHQGIRAVSYNPKGFINGDVFKYIGEYFTDTMNSTKASQFTQWLDKSGVMAAVDKQNLVRGTLLEAANHSNRVYQPIATVGDIVRKYGYDIGEQGNLLAHAAAVYERWTRKGHNLADKATADLAHSELRAITGDMNYAGDLVYNQTSPAILMQFFMAPHKTALMVFNRRLDAGTKARMIAGDALLWGAPTRLVSDFLGGDILPDNPMAREALVYGLESMLTNEALRRTFDNDDINIDMSSLTPYDFAGVSKLYKTMLNDGPLGVLAQSPAYQMFAKDQGKLPMFMASLSRFFATNSGLYPLEGQEPHSAMAVVRDFGRIFSGVSNSMDAWIMVKTGQVADKYGNIVDPSTNHVEATAKFFGFQLRSEADYWYVSQELSGKHKDLRDEVKKTVDISARLIYNSTDDQMETYKQLTNYALSKYENNPIAMQYVNQELIKVFNSDKYPGLEAKMYNSVGIQTGKSLKDLMKQTPGMTEDERTKAVQVIEDFENSLKGNK